MQNLLDRTQESLAEGFARLTRHAARQRRLYVDTILVLIGIIAVSATLLAALAIGKDLEYTRNLRTQDAANFDYRSRRAQSFLRRSELTLRYYEATQDVQRVPDDVEQAVRARGVATGNASVLDMRYDLLVSDATRAAWGDQLNANLWRIAAAADSTLATREALDIPYRSMIIGLADDYAVLMPGVAATNDPQTSALSPGLIGKMREAIESNLKAQTGSRLPAKGAYLLTAPYRDPLSGDLVSSAVTAYYADDKPVALIAMIVPLAEFYYVAPRSAHDGTLIYVGWKKVLKTQPALDPATARELADRAARLASGQFGYSTDGVLFYLPINSGYGTLISYLTWPEIAAAIRWQLAAIFGVALLLALAVILTAKYWG